jgi:serine/threonine-protein kinase
MPPRQLNPNIPPALEEIILRCLEKVPEMRFADGSVLARALELLGEEELAGNGSSAATSVMPGGPITPPPPVASSFNNQMPTHVSGVGYPQSASSPNNHMGGYPASPYNQNGMQDNGAATMRADQPFVPGTMAGEQPYQMFPGDAGSTRPFQKDSMSPRTGVVGTQRDSRFASIITILILLATLLLLGFSIYLASELGFINFGSQQPTPSPTAVTATAVPTVTVPDLKGMTLQQAQDALTKLNLKLHKRNGPDDGVIVDQSTQANNTTQTGSTIVVDTKAAVKVPDGLVGNTVDADTQLLKQANIPYEVVDDGFDNTQNYNTVTKTDPPAGTVLKDGQKVTLHVVNVGTPPTQTPPTPTTQPTQAPTQAPTPTPTPRPTRTPTPTPKPKPSPTTSDTTPIATDTPTS